MASGTLRSMPVHYIRSVSKQELVAPYCAADVMPVTPLRDGMNLVARELVASRVESLRERVVDNDVHAWARGFPEQLADAQPPPHRRDGGRASPGH
jgi:trehalose-6-phosphate synthase